MRIKDVVTLRNEKTTDNTMPYIALDNIISWDAKYVESNTETEGTNSIFKKGDVLFGKLRPYLAKGFCPSYDGICSTEFFVMTPKKGFSPHFLLYYFLSVPFIDYIKNQVAGVKMPRTKWDDFGGISVNIPSYDEQLQIVDYLDKKLSTIDHRIEVLEKEKDAYARLKKSVINQAVTCGLNPDVALKDSGIDWIGMMPKHWAVKRVKDVCKVVCGATPKDNQLYWDGDIIWISPSDMTEFGEIEKGARTITYDGYQSCGTTLVPKNSIIMSTRAPIGKTNIALNEMCTNQGCKCLTSKSLHMRYMLYTIWSKKENFQALGRGTTFIELSTKDLSLFYLALPPLSEQQAIATYLDEKCAKIDAAIENINKQIDASKRLKKAVINEAIGGKIQM